jgi:hypothetical protein
MMNIKIFLILILALSMPAWSEQDSLVDKIIRQKIICSSDCLFSARQIKSPQSSRIYKQKIFDLMPASTDFLREELVKDLNLIPVNECVLRGNRNYALAEGSTLLDKLKVENIVTMDSWVKKIHKLKDVPHELIYLPVEQKQYPVGESMASIIKALGYLAEATPYERVYISCFFGKHRTGLVVGLYQFVRHYADNPQAACAQIGTREDETFLQMNTIANLGLLTYDMPVSYMQFYRNFAKSICEQKSKEFIEGHIEISQ